MTVKSLVRLYGGYQKQQRQNFVLVQKDALGEVVNLRVDGHGVSVALCKFNVDGRYVWVRCAPALLESI